MPEEGAKIPVGLEFAVEGNGEEGLGKLAELAEHLSEKMEHVSGVFTEILGIAGAIGAGFSLTKIMEETQDHLRAVERVTYSTGLATEAADGLLESMEKEGVGAEEGAMILERLSLSALRNQETVNGMRRSYMLLGVDLRRGLIPSILELSKKMKEGRLTASQLQLGMEGLRPAMAAQFIRFLQQGPEKIREQMKELKESGMAINAENLTALQEQRQALGEMNATWKRMAIVVGKELMPVVTDLMNYVTDAVKDWTPAVQRFGRALRDHMTEAVSIAKTFTKILLANALLSKVGAGGIYGAAKGTFGALGGLVSQGSEWASRGMVGGPGLASMAPGLASTLGGAGALAASVGLVAVIAAGIAGILENTKGVRDFLGDAVGDLRDAAEEFGSLFAKGTAGGEFLDDLKTILPLALSTAAEAIRLFLDGLTAMAKFLGYIIDDIKTNGLSHALSPNGLSASWNQAAWDIGYEKQQRQERKVDEAARAAIESIKKWSLDTAPINNQNFYNASFDITQKFEEGFEPDRILAAFTNDLAALGERGNMSPFSPHGAVGIVGGGG